MVSEDKKTTGNAVWLAAARLKLRKEANGEALAEAAHVSMEELEREVAAVLEEQFSHAQSPQTAPPDGPVRSAPTGRRTRKVPSSSNGSRSLIGAVERVLREAGHPLQFHEIHAELVKMGKADPNASPSRVIWTPIHRLAKYHKVVVEGRKPRTVRLLGTASDGESP